MKVYEKVLNYLSKNNVTVAFGYPTATISPMVDHLNDFKDIEYVVTKNESAASFAAEKYAKIGKKLGLLLISGSVGLGNSMNGITEAFQSKSPMLILTGYLNMWQHGKGGIQELPKEYLPSATKYSKRVTNPNDAIKELNKALKIAYTQPMGPVHVELPLDIQNAEYIGEDFDIVIPPKIKTNYTVLDEAIDILNNCNNGFIIVGGGCRGLREKIKKLETKLNWKMVTTTSSKGVINESYPLNMGNWGFPGTDYANSTVIFDKSIDCILALGTQLGENSTQNFSQELIKDRRLIHVDIDMNAFNRAYHKDVQVLADLNEALDYIYDKINYKKLHNNISEPLNLPYVPGHTGISLRKAYENITNILPQNTFYINDIGESMNYAFSYLNVPEEGDFDCNIGYACMGSSTGAIGISKLYPDRLIAQFIGDGAFFMNGMNELLTYKKYNMNIICFVVNNSNLGFVNRGHEILFGRTVPSFYDEYVDVSGIVNAMGIKTLKVEKDEDLYNLKAMELKGPLVVELVCDSTEPIPLGRLTTLNKVINNK
jgi:Thiamine pyrophosphate-requiring enzymes [acetolactate synthase, pyruvate dehydrogenase (cytochrome), glyoxylate carboligase, phosphonopyruvate decarboxylase]